MPSFSRVTNIGRFQGILAGFRPAAMAAVRAQQQVATGLRIQKPSDDPTGSARVLLLDRRVAEAERYLAATSAGLGQVDATASALTGASDILNDARTVFIEAMNGTLTNADRQLLANEIDMIREDLLGIANLDYDARFVFGGTSTADSPWSESTIGGIERVQYIGSQETVSLRVGNTLEVISGVPGSDIFAKDEQAGLRLGSLTGIQLGTSANQGTGFEVLTLRHDSTDVTGLAGVGITSAGGGADDTLLGDSTIVIDPVAGTVQLGTGPVVTLPDPAHPDSGDFVVTNELGAELHLDLTGYNGAPVTTTVSGAGSISIDGASFDPIDFAETDFELVHPETGAIINVDLTGVGRAGPEMATFTGTVNLFDTLAGFSWSLRNEADLGHDELVDQMKGMLTEFDRNRDNLLNETVAMGTRSGQLQKTHDRLTASQVQMEELRSEIRDTDFSEALLTMAQAETILQVAQATGVRLLQNTLLNFLR